jgi:hypothetical protein
LKTALAANNRLDTAYPRKESIDELWHYGRGDWVRRFLSSWRSSLKWLQHEPHEEFAEMIERHSIGISV